MFRQLGIKSVTMDDIAKNIGVSKRTIYENFPNKNELLKACLGQHAKDHRLCHKQLLESSSNVIDSIMSIMYEGIKSMNETHPSFFSDLKKYHYKIWQEVMTATHQEKLNEIKSLIQRGINQGFFRSDIDIDIMVRIWDMQLSALSNDSIFPSSQFAKADVFKNLILSFTRGIATLKGLEEIERVIESKKVNN